MYVCCVIKKSYRQRKTKKQKLMHSWRNQAQVVKYFQYVDNTYPHTLTLIDTQLLFRLGFCCCCFFFQLFITFFVLSFLVDFFTCCLFFPIQNECVNSDDLKNLLIVYSRCINCTYILFQIAIEFKNWKKILVYGYILRKCKDVRTYIRSFL